MSGPLWEIPKLSRSAEPLIYLEFHKSFGTSLSWICLEIMTQSPSNLSLYKAKITNQRKEFSVQRVNLYFKSTVYPNSRIPTLIFGPTVALEKWISGFVCWTKAPVRYFVRQSLQGRDIWWLLIQNKPMISFFFYSVLPMISFWPKNKRRWKSSPSYRIVFSCRGENYVPYHAKPRI